MKLNRIRHVKYNGTSRVELKPDTARLGRTGQDTKGESRIRHNTREQSRTWKDTTGHMRIWQSTTRKGRKKYIFKSTTEHISRINVRIS
jgi:hypothetical protein